MTYKALGRSIANYAAPAWNTNSSESNIGKIQHAQNEALRFITGSHKMSSIDHLHSATGMIQVEDHLNLLSAQYLVHCLDTENVCHHITKMDQPPREMKETIFTRHNQTVLPQQTHNHTQKYCELYHQKFTNTVRHATHKTNRSINITTQNIQGYTITLTTTLVQETLKQSKNNNSQGPATLNIRYPKHIT